jgi:hypothetical protein
MKRENLHAAERIIHMLEHLEKVDRVVEVAYKNKFLGYSGIAVKLTDDLEYMFPDNIEFSMFYNILKSSIEGEIEKLNKHLEEL